jgi:hypothetical protein
MQPDKPEPDEIPAPAKAEIPPTPPDFPETPRPEPPPTPFPAYAGPTPRPAPPSEPVSELTDPKGEWRADGLHDIPRPIRTG